MAGGRYSSVVVGPYNTEKVYFNNSGAAASITISGTALSQNDSATVSINISQQNICAQCSTTFASNVGTLNYSRMITVPAPSGTCNVGMACFSSTPCNSYLIPTYTDSSNVNYCTYNSNLHSSTHFYSPPVYPSTRIVGFSTGGTDSVAIAPLGNSCRYGHFTVSGCYNNTDCPGTLNAGCYYCGIHSGSSNVCASTCASQASTGLSGAFIDQGVQTCDGHSSAIDYWSSIKTITKLDRSTWCVCQIYSNCPTCFSCGAFNAKFNSVLFCCLSGGSGVCTAFSGKCYATIFTCMCACIGIQGALSQRIISAGRCMVVLQDPTCAAVSFRAHNAASATAVNAMLCVPGTTGVMLCFSSSPSFISPVRWMTFNHNNTTNYFMWYNEFTPLWNGVYSVKEDQLFNIACLSCSAASTCCLVYPAPISCYFIKISDVPNFVCCIGSKFFTGTTPVATDENTFVWFVSNWNRYGVMDCLCRYVSNDLVNWYCTSATSYGQCLTANSAVSGNTTHTCGIVSNYGNLCSAGTIECFTTAKNIERTGVVVSNGDHIYVENESAVPVAVSVWGFTE